MVLNVAMSCPSADVYYSEVVIRFQESLKTTLIKPFDLVNLMIWNLTSLAYMKATLREAILESEKG